MGRGGPGDRAGRRAGRGADCVQWIGRASIRGRSRGRASGAESVYLMGIYVEAEAEAESKSGAGADGVHLMRM